MNISQPEQIGTVEPEKPVSIGTEPFRKPNRLPVKPNRTVATLVLPSLQHLELGFPSI